MELLSTLIDSNKDRLEELEKTLGHSFRDLGLLQLALIHRSYAFEHDARQDVDNERLEFLGDAVLDLIIGYALFEKYPEMREGELTKLRAMLVNEAHLAEMAENISLGGFLYLGKGEDSSHGRRKPSILSCSYEAVVGAIFHDGGYGAASDFVRRHFLPRLDARKEQLPLADAKSTLQELTQGKYNEAPVYVLEKAEGPDHCKVFTVSVRFRDEVLAYGRATSKKEAEQKGAAAALLKLAGSDIPGAP
ncbi:MAG: ribonuclease III [Desulfurivibrionaceae bacterium]|nr:ribonuclease III [Desulfobulbales bacterium]MDT8335693.1 ribonuclease III [Desulfurivibrionaceae bacterium]